MPQIANTVMTGRRWMILSNVKLEKSFKRMRKSSAPMKNGPNREHLQVTWVCFGCAKSIHPKTSLPRGHPNIDMNSPWWWRRTICQHTLNHSLGTRSERDCYVDGSVRGKWNEGRWNVFPRASVVGVGGESWSFVIPTDIVPDKGSGLGMVGSASCWRMKTFRSEKTAQVKI